MIKAYDVLHQFELLNSSHVVSGFVCGNSYLDTYLRSYTLQDNIANQARTYVCRDLGAPASQAIAGYFTLRADAFYTEDNHVVPVVEITHLARHFSRKGQDWGNVLLSELLPL